MQRRAAAAYFVLFMVISAGAYAYIGMAERPTVDVPGQTYGVGDNLSVDERTYTVNAIGGSGEITGNLTWTDSDATYTAALSNNSTVSWQTASWDDQAVERVPIANDTSVTFNGSEYVVELNASADPPTVRLWKAGWPPAGTNTSNATRPNTTFEAGDTVSLETGDGQFVPDGTITEVTAESATLSWGNTYYILVSDEADPTSVSLTEQRNVTRVLVTDSQVENTLGQYANGTQFVQYRNGSRQLIDSYLPALERKTFSEGETIVYEGNETTVGNITREEVPLNWTGAKSFLVELSEGATVDLNNQTYLVHFPDASTVEFVRNNTANFETYQTDQATIEKYEERKAGLWGVTILSTLAGLILLAAAYLPVKD